MSLSKYCYFDKDSANLSIDRSIKYLDGIERKELLKEVYGIQDDHILLYEDSISSEDCLDFLLNGGTIAQCFRIPFVKSVVRNCKVVTFNYRRDGFFDFTIKSNTYFTEANFIGIDIDKTSYPSARDFISMLPNELQPTFWYTTYSNMQTEKDGSPKGARFRMIYFLDTPIENIFYFKFKADYLMDTIESYTGEKINDRCGNRVSQYFNGTCIRNEDLVIDFGHTGKIFSHSELGGTEGEYYNYLTSPTPCNYSMSYWKVPEHIDYLESCIAALNSSIFYQSNPIIPIEAEVSIANQAPDIDKSQRKQDLERWRSSLNQDFLKDLKKNDFNTNEALHKYRGYLEYFYQTEIPVECNYMFAKRVPDNYFRLWYPKERLVKDRMRTILFRMVCRRFMKPTTTPEEIIFNAAEDVRRFIDNSDGKFNWSSLTDKAFYVFSLTHQELLEIWGDSINELANITFPKSGWVFEKGITESQRKRFLGVQKEIREKNFIREVCDDSLTVKENLKRLEEYGLKMCEDTFTKRTKEDKERKKQEIYNLVNPELSVRENQKNLMNLGYKKGISKDSIHKIIKNKKKH